MTWQTAFLTVLGGFILPFAIIILWPRLIERYQALGGFIACLTIIGTIWIFNHGLEYPLISQQSSVFIDMGFSVGIGSIVAGLRQKKRWRQTLPIALAAIFGGGLAGLLLSVMF